MKELKMKQIAYRFWPFMLCRQKSQSPYCKRIVTFGVKADVWGQSGEEKGVPLWYAQLANGGRKLQPRQKVFRVPEAPAAEASRENWKTIGSQVVSGSASTCKLPLFLLLGSESSQAGRDNFYSPKGRSVLQTVVLYVQPFINCQAPSSRHT